MTIEKTISWCPRYSITNTGLVISYIGETKILKQRITDRGYAKVKLSFEPIEKGKYIQREYNVHRLVAEFFCDEYSEDKEIHHIDLNRQNNHWDNLLPLTKQQHLELHKQLNEKENNKQVNKT